MIALEGSHGTAKTLADNICKYGFLDNKNSNLWGSGGVYFFKDSLSGVDHAVKWHQKKLEKNDYAACEDKRCCVIQVDISSPKVNYIDITTAEFKEILAKLNERARMAGRSSRKARAIVCDNFLRQLESKLKSKIKVFFAPIPLDRSYFHPHYRTNCIIVNDIDCIHKPYLKGM